MAKQSEPTQDFGFYAAVPRLVRTHYTSLTAVQKWLYVCLKDLCGDHGTCYRALRTLSEETGISTGMLSESIRALHEAKLVHAEKKKRSTGGKEVWHITIVDIWSANGKLHPAKRSQSEQNKVSEPSQNENVHPVKDNVQTVNKRRGKRSPAEPECSHSETEERTTKQEHFEEKKEKETALSFSEKKSVEEDDFSLVPAGFLKPELRAAR